VTARLHLPAHDEREGAEVGRALCGTNTKRHAVLLAPPGEATCKLCLKAHGSRREYTRAISWLECVHDVATLLAGPRVELPPVTPDS
jgi:hypothetical protein